MDGDRHPDCPFCEIIHEDRDKLTVETAHLAGFRDAYPVNPGHTLIVPRTHLATFEAFPAEWGAELLAAVNSAMAEIEPAHDPDGYNLGMNLREAAGQTVDHLHWHVIPRYAGDVENPEGGIRGVIPDKQQY